MSWNQLTLEVPDDLTDAVIGELSDDGVAGVWESEGGHLGSTRLVLYFSLKSDLDGIERRLQSIFERCRRTGPRIERSIVEDCDWTGEWKKSYRSFPIGNDFFVIPSWEATGCPDERLPIRIDPGQAFGTGTHETTQLTMEALERWVEPAHAVLDIGTGSGILAIASRLLGAREVFACDIDPVAVKVAQANIDRNAEHDVWTFCGSVDAVRKGSVQLVLCNLTADLITSLFGEIDRVMPPQAIAILSGILHEQREEVCQTLERYEFTVHEEMTRGEWLALVAEKHGD